MGDSHDKGAFQADIPARAVEEALESVERVEGASAGAEVRIEAEAEAGAGPDAAALAARVESLEAQLELSQTKGRELLDKLKEEHERLLRTAADLDNYRKRAAREREDVQRFGVEALVKDLLPVVDNLDRALAAAPAGDPMVDGVKLVRAGLEAALARHGVRAFSAMGQPFDPAVHEALLQVPSDAKPGTVVLEHGRGFKLHDRLVRPAMVGVAIAAPGAQAEPAGAAAPPAGDAPGDGQG